MTFIRKIKKKSGTYLAEVKSYRDGGKIKQKVIKYLGKEIGGQIVRKIYTKDIKLESVKRSIDILSIDKIAKELHLDSIENKEMLALTYSHLLEKRSINKLETWLRFTEIPEVLEMTNTSTSKLYDALTFATNTDLDTIESKIYSTTRGYENNATAAIVDVTDIYFEGKTQKIKPRRGKDGKVCQLLQIGLATSLNNGFPIFHKTYHGNLPNVHIFKDMILELKKRGLDSTIVDRGMLSEENLKALLSLAMKAIAGVRKSNSLTNDYVSKIKREEIFSAKNRVKLKNTSVYVQSFDYFNGKLIVVYNPLSEIANKERYFEREEDPTEKYPGYSLIYHNTDIPDTNVVKKYYEKDIVERAFKQLKGIISIRPVRVWLKEHVEGHVRICYLAYAILALMNYRLKKLGISAVDALNSLKHGYKVNLIDETTQFKWDLIVPLEPKQRDILKALNVVYKK